MAAPPIPRNDVQSLPQLLVETTPAAWRYCLACGGLSRPPAYPDRCPCGAKTRLATGEEIESRGVAPRVRDAVAVRGRRG